MTEPASSFEAVIVPHRSLSAAGVRRVAGALVGLSGLVSLGLYLAGAWPVIGFTGLEAAAAIWLMRRHATGPRGTELLVLTEAELHITRVDRRGRRTRLALPAGWLGAHLVERAGRVPALLLRGQGRSVEVAAALGEEEKRQLAAALQDALRRQRNPIFDNPQLRAD